jgi:YVTN family beta-propeller protein
MRTRKTCFLRMGWASLCALAAAGCSGCGEGSVTGSPRVVVVVPARLDFGTVAVGAKHQDIVLIQSVGPSPAALSAARIDTGGSADFSLGAFSPVTLQTGETAVIQVFYMPGEEGEDAAELAVESDAQGAPQRVALAGVGAVFCEDRDADGFGAGCDLGPDCDDGSADAHAGATELCDGEDNDCDGQTDEGFGVGQTCFAGQGQCLRSGQRACDATRLAALCNATPGTPGTESCNNLDDDCDGDTDEEVVVACYSGPAGTETRGTCRTGYAACARGLFGPCEGEVKPGDEVCGDGLDNDCDGQTDENAGACSGEIFVALEGADQVAVLDRVTLTEKTRFTVRDTPRDVEYARALDRLLVVNTFDDSVSVLDATSGAEIARIATGRQPEEVALSTDGQRAFAAGFRDGAMSIIDVAAARAVAVANVGAWPGGMAALRRPGAQFDDLWIAHGDVGNTTNQAVSVYATGASSLTRTAFIPTASSNFQVDAGFGGATAWVTTRYGQKNVRVFDTATRALVAEYDIGDDPWETRFTPDGSKAVIADLDGAVVVVNAATGAIIRTIAIPSSQIVSVLVWSDGVTAWACDRSGGKVHEVNLSTGAVPRAVTLGGSPRAMAIK